MYVSRRFENFVISHSSHKATNYRCSSYSLFSHYVTSEILMSTTKIVVHFFFFLLFFKMNDFFELDG